MSGIRNVLSNMLTYKQAYFLDVVLEIGVIELLFFNSLVCLCYSCWYVKPQIAAAAAAFGFVFWGSVGTLAALWETAVVKEIKINF